VEVLSWDAVVSAQMSLGLVPEVLDAVDVVAAGCGEGLSVIDPVMMEARDVEAVSLVVSPRLRSLFRSI